MINFKFTANVIIQESFKCEPCRDKGALFKWNRETLNEVIFACIFCNKAVLRGFRNYPKWQPKLSDFYFGKQPTWIQYRERDKDDSRETN